MKVFALLVSFVLSIFSSSVDREGTNLAKDQDTVTIALVGDIMLGRTVMTTALDSHDPTYPFAKVTETLNSVDIVFANLENPFVSKCPRHTTGMNFCADPQLAKGLVFGGIDVVTLANNHTLNYGSSGLAETKTVLTANGIAFTGDGNLVLKTVGDTTLGFLGFNKVGGGTPFSQEELHLVNESDKKADILIVGVHWGEEYMAEANSYQRNWAKQLIENGADVVAGHHPHWVQDFEYIDGKPVYYSLGNFIFDQMWSEETKKGLIVKLTVRKNELLGEERIPIYMSKWAQPAISN